MEELYERLSQTALSLPGVVEGQRFGMPGWFVRKRFFAHCHKARDTVLLEVRLDKDEVRGELPAGIRPHPSYSQHGWVRLVVKGELDLEKAEALLKKSYLYMTTVRKVWLPRHRGLQQRVSKLSRNLTGVIAQMKPELGHKRLCVLVTPKDLFDPEARRKVEAAALELRRLSR